MNQRGFPYESKGFEGFKCSLENHKPRRAKEKSGIKNIARDTFKYETVGEHRRLITPEKIIGKEGQKGFFSPEDYQITPGGKAGNFLQKIKFGKRLNLKNINY